MYTDDVVISTDGDRESCEERLGQWTSALERYGMKVSRTKTECLQKVNFVLRTM